MSLLYTGKAGAQVLVWANFHSDQGTLVDPDPVALEVRSPGGGWTSLGTPTKQNSQTGAYGAVVDTTGYTPGTYAFRLSGTVATAKVVALEHSIVIVANDASDVMTALSTISATLQLVAREATVVAGFASMGSTSQATDLLRGVAKLLPFKMESTAGVPVAGAYVTCSVNLSDGRGYVACANTVTEMGGGMYSILLTAAEMNAEAIALRAVAAGARQMDLTLLTDVAA